MYILVLLNNCVVCGFVLCHSSSILFRYECRVGHLFVLSWARVRRLALGC